MFVMEETWACLADVGKQRKKEKERRFRMSKVFRLVEEMGSRVWAEILILAWKRDILSNEQVEGKGSEEEEVISLQSGI